MALSESDFNRLASIFNRQSITRISPKDLSISTKQYYIDIEPSKFYVYLKNSKKGTISYKIKSYKQVKKLLAFYL